MKTIDYNCGNQTLEATLESASVRLSIDLIHAARTAAKAQHRTLQGQIEYWARVGKANLENPDLPVDFVAASLESLAEPRSEATAFTPRSA
jgi:hypothetical protein